MDYPVALVSGLFSVFVFGMVVSVLGTIKLKLTPKIGADDAQFGKLVSVLQFTMVIMAIGAGIIKDNIGFKLAIMIGFLGTGVAIFLLGSAKSYGVAIIACILLGIGGQFVNVGGNTLVPSLFEDEAKASNLGNTFFGLGAFLLPVVCAWLLEKMDLQKALLIIAVFTAILFFIPLGGEFPQTGKGFEAAMVGSVLSQVVTWCAALTLFCYIGLEVSMATWITSYASELGADDAAAGRTLSIFFLCMMASRLLFGLQNMFDLTEWGRVVLTGAAILSAIVIFWMISSKSIGMGRIAVGFAGFFFGPVFPTTVGVTFSHFDQSEFGTVFGIIFGIGLLGASTIPAWIGTLAKGKSVANGLKILMVTAIILAVIAFVLGSLPATEAAAS